jgi:DNA polymerase sigma
VKPSKYIIAHSIYNRIEQILLSRFNYNIKVVKHGSIPINLATENSDCNALIQFPENFSLNYISIEFERVKRYLQESGYQLISEWKTPQGSRILKFKDYNSEFIINIRVYEEILVMKTNLVNAYCNLHPDIYKAIMLIKVWADRRKLNDPATTNVISSYCHILMFITYLIIIGAVPNLRTIPPEFNLWKAKDIEYSPEIEPLQKSGPDKICSRYCKLISYENNIIPVYFNERIDVKLGYNWDIQKAITGYFYFMGFKYNYREWDISIYHGYILESSVRVESIDSQTRLLRVRNPFKSDQIESNSALPWCIDGLKWEFMRGYKLLCNSDWTEFIHEVIPPCAEEVHDYDIYTYLSMY